MITAEPRPLIAPDLISLAEQIARCRRLAAEIGDGITRARLLELAVAYEARMVEITAF
jgi:hypothetical protein